MQSRETKPEAFVRRLCNTLPGALVMLMMLLLGRTISGQTFSASIAGTITDASGAVVAGVDLQLQNRDTKDIRTFISGTRGSYEFNNLLPGTYDLKATARGFKEFIQSNMILRANTAATVDISLPVGGAEQRVEVSGEAVLLDTETANNSITMDSTLIENLPNNTRNPLNFVFDLAGVTEAQGSMTSRSNTYDQVSSTFGVNGGRTGESEILVDGVAAPGFSTGAAACNQ